MLFTAISLIVCFVAVIRRRKQFSKLQFLLILVYLLAPVSVMLPAMELMLLVDQGKRYIKQKEEIADQKAAFSFGPPKFFLNPRRTFSMLFYLLSFHLKK